MGVKISHKKLFEMTVVQVDYFSSCFLRDDILRYDDKDLAQKTVRDDKCYSGLTLSSRRQERS